MTTAFARYLPQFPATRPGDLLAGNEIFFSPKAKSKESVRDVVAEAEERGRREGTAAANAEAERARSDAEAAFERRMGHERRQWTETQADLLAARIAEGLHEIETRLATDAARILLPFLETAVRRKALDELAGTLHEILTDSRHTGLTITGPEDLLAMIRSRLGADAAMLSFVVDEAPDVRIAGDDTAIQTQLRAWVEHLQQAVAET
jgi:hypothetical protein